MVLAAVAIAALAAACEIGSRTASSPAHTGPTPPPGSPLIGSWTTTITRADMAGAGITDPGIVNENTGRFTWTFSPDGTWRVVQESLDDVAVLYPVYAGTFSVDGDHLGATTDFPEQYRDSGIRYRWEITPQQGLQLSVENPPDPIAPIIAETRPWQPVRS